MLYTLMAKEGKQDNNLLSEVTTTDRNLSVQSQKSVSFTLNLVLSMQLQLNLKLRRQIDDQKLIQANSNLIMCMMMIRTESV